MGNEDTERITISDWLDEKEAEKVDVTHLTLPANLAFDEDPEETIFFEEFKPCGLLCTENHPFSTVERFGHWYYAKGQDKKAGIHSSTMTWHMFTKDKNHAVQTAKTHLK